MKKTRKKLPILTQSQFEALLKIMRTHTESVRVTALRMVLVGGHSQTMAAEVCNTSLPSVNRAVSNARAAMARAKAFMEA